MPISGYYITHFDLPSNSVKSYSSYKKALLYDHFAFFKSKIMEQRSFELARQKLGLFKLKTKKLLELNLNYLLPVHYLAFNIDNGTNYTLTYADIHIL